jgi:hypothetical protein
MEECRYKHTVENVTIENQIHNDYNTFIKKNGKRGWGAIFTDRNWTNGIYEHETRPCGILSVTTSLRLDNVILTHTKLSYSLSVRPSQLQTTKASKGWETIIIKERITVW